MENDPGHPRRDRLLRLASICRVTAAVSYAVAAVLILLSVGAWLWRRYADLPIIAPWYVPASLVAASAVLLIIAARLGSRARPGKHRPRPKD